MPFRIDPTTLDFDLPEDLIAQTPAPVRDQARLLVLHRKNGDVEHRRFVDLPEFLKKGDVLVLNRAKVSKAKLIGKKNTGGKLEVIFLEKMNGGSIWRGLLRPTVKDGVQFNVEDNQFVVQERLASGEFA